MCNCQYTLPHNPVPCSAVNCPIIQLIVHLSHNPTQCATARCPIIRHCVRLSSLPICGVGSLRERMVRRMTEGLRKIVISVDCTAFLVSHSHQQETRASVYVTKGLLNSEYLILEFPVNHAAGIRASKSETGCSINRKYVSINQLICQLISPSIVSSINESASRFIIQTVYLSIILSTSQSTNQSVSHSISQSIYRLVHRPVCHSAGLSISQSVTQSAYQSINRSVSHSVRLSINRSN